MSEEKPGDALHHEFSFTCPYCCRFAAVARKASGEPTLVHVAPPCERFIDADFGQYLRDASAAAARANAHVRAGGGSA